MDTNERKRKASRLLTNYARLGLEATGSTWGPDNDAEIETLVDLLIGDTPTTGEVDDPEVDDDDRKAWRRPKPDPESDDLSYEAWRRTHRVTA